MSENNYLIKSKKIISADDNIGTVYNGAMVVENGKIRGIGDYSTLKSKYLDLEELDYNDYIITPSLVDCHTHLLEYAPTSLFPVTKKTHLMGGISLLLKAISSGITALGEQICGHPLSDLGKPDYEDLVKDLPIDIIFSLSSISIGLENIVNFTGITGSKTVEDHILIDNNLNKELANLSEYPGENLFINATPANFQESMVPRAGEIIYSKEELNNIVGIFRGLGKKIGCHVAGEDAIEMAIETGFDVIHHAHGINDEQIHRIKEKNILIVATPLGGTHLPPNNTEDIAKLVLSDIITAISTDGYLPPSNKAPWLEFNDNDLKGPEVLMYIAQPSMVFLNSLGLDENQVLKLITLNPAKVLGKDHIFGSLNINKDANFLVSKGVPGLEITNPEGILKVFYKGEMVISR